MPKLVEGKTYLNAKEAATVFGVSRQTFYENVKRYLRPYHPGRKSAMYLEDEVRALAAGTPIRLASIEIRGMFHDWTADARRLGFNVSSTDCGVTITQLPTDLSKQFSVSSEKLFVKRSRMSFIDRTPICAWDSYYPQEYVNDILPQIKDGSAHDIVSHIQSVHGVTVGFADDIYSVRVTTFEEQNRFQLLNDEPLIVLQRVAYTADRQVAVLLSDMQLLGKWFVVRRSEPVYHWQP